VHLLHEDGYEAGAFVRLPRQPASITTCCSSAALARAELGALIAAAAKLRGSLNLDAAFRRRRCARDALAGDGGARRVRIELYAGGRTTPAA